jgi:WD40 repeat protein/serine/threonine protein kinase
MAETNDKSLPGDHDDEVLARIVDEIGERIKQGEPVDQAAYLRRHPEYAERLRSLWPALVATVGLRQSESPVGFSIDPPSTEADGSGEGGNRRLGDFRLIREIARGGMGIVYEAVQISLRRRVALKILTAAGSIDDRQLQRFQIEARAAAALHHAHIVPVFAVGTHRRVPFYAMQFIEGISLATLIAEMRQLEGLEQTGPAAACALTQSFLAGHCALALSGGSTVEIVGPRPRITLSDAAGATPVVSQSRARSNGFARDVAALGVQAASALEHAHDHGILHRDVKPSNLLVDEAGHLWVTDFGLARVQGESNLTQTGDMLGTLRYMSPESAAGRGKRVFVDGRTDIYSLGVTLYALLTLRPAFPGDDRVEVFRQIAQDEPTPLRKLDSSIPRDLETIIDKAIAKDPARRYAMAGAMAEDLRRFLEHRPILAQRPTVADRAAKFARRHRPFVVSAAGFVLLAVLGLVASLSWSNRWLRSHNQGLSEALKRADENAREAERQGAIAQAQLDLARRHQHAENLRRARQALDAREVELAQDILRGDQRGLDGKDRDFAWRYLWRQSRRDFRQIWGHHGRIRGITLAPDGRSLAIHDFSGQVRICDLKDEATFDQPRAAFATRYAEAALSRFSADSRYVAVGSPDEWFRDRGIEVFDCQTSQRVVQIPLGPGERIDSVAFDQPSKRFWVAMKQRGQYGLGFHELTNPDSPEQSRPLERDVTRAVLSPDARMLCLQREGGVDLVETPCGKVLLRLNCRKEDKPWPGCFSMDSRYLMAATGADIVVWETGGGRVIARIPASGAMAGWGWSARARYLSWGEDNGRVGILDTSTGAVRELVPRSSAFKATGFAPSFSAHEKLFTYNQRRIPGGPTPLRVWNLETGLIAEFPNRNVDRDASFVLGRHEVLLRSGAGLGIWKLHPPRELDALAGHRAEAWAAAFSADGKTLATASDDTGEQQTIRLWDPTSGKQLAGWKGHASMISALAFSPDGGILASASLDSGKSGQPNLRLWSTATQERLGDLAGHEGGVRAVTYSPDGLWLATAGDDGAVRLWDPNSRLVQTTLIGHSAKVNSLSFSSDGRLLASSSNDATVRLWDVSSGQSQAVLADLREVFAVRFAPDQSLLASVNELGELKLWDPIEARLVRAIPGDSQELRALAFPAGSSVIAAAGKGKVIHFWDVATGQEILTLEGHKAQINGLAFSPDGSVLASCSHDGAVRLWCAGGIEP